MFRMQAVPVLLVAGVIIGGCRDDGRLIGPGPRFDLSDSSNPAGNPFFHILSPVGSGQTTAAFNPHLNPVVEICRLSDADVSGTYPSTGCVAGASPLITAETGPGEGDVRLVDDYYQYQLRSEAHPFEVGVVYRMHVRVGKVLGYADIQPVANPTQLRLVPEGIYGFQLGSTVPFKFSIDEGAFCWPETACSEYTIDPAAGGTFNNGNLFVIALPNFVDPSGGTRTFELVNATDLPCLPTTFVQYEACVEVRMHPALEPGEEFNYLDMQAGEGETVFIAMCLDPAANEHHARKFKAPDKPWEATTTYEPLGPPGEYIFNQAAACADWAPTQPGGHRVGGWAAASRVRDFYARHGRPLVEWIFGTPAYGGDLVLFSSVRTLTRFGWVREIRLQAADASATVMADVALTARVTSIHAEEDHAEPNDHDLGVNGVNVEFACIDGGTGYASCSHASGTAAAVSAGAGSATGHATADWSFAEPGTYRMEVTTPQDGATAVRFDVVVTDWSATFLMPLVQNAPAPLATQNTTASGTVRATCQAGSCAGTVLAELPFGPANFSDGRYQVQWRIGGAQAGDIIVVSVHLNGVRPIGDATFVVAGDPRFNVGRNLPVQFRIER
ncbi:MAG TPA: hypothetical protein VK929_09615 [Longimicrobiales bacterium]|nr:hypothetical protein [Longimicrobiales bacterium]